MHVCTVEQYTFYFYNISDLVKLSRILRNELDFVSLCNLEDLVLSIGLSGLKGNLRRSNRSKF